MYILPIVELNCILLKKTRRNWLWKREEKLRRMTSKRPLWTMIFRFKSKNLNECEKLNINTPYHTQYTHTHIRAGIEVLHPQSTCIKIVYCWHNIFHSQTISHFRLFNSCIMVWFFAPSLTTIFTCISIGMVWSSSSFFFLTFISGVSSYMILNDDISNKHTSTIHWLFRLV